MRNETEAVEVYSNSLETNLFRIQVLCLLLLTTWTAFGFFICTSHAMLSLWCAPCTPVVDSSHFSSRTQISHQQCQQYQHNEYNPHAPPCTVQRKVQVCGANFYVGHSGTSVCLFDTHCTFALSLLSLLGVTCSPLHFAVVHNTESKHAREVRISRFFQFGNGGTHCFFSEPAHQFLDTTRYDTQT